MFDIVLPSASALLYVFQYCRVTTDFALGVDAADVPEIANIDPPNINAANATTSRVDFAVLPLINVFTFMIDNRFLFSCGPSGPTAGFLALFLGPLAPVVHPPPPTKTFE
jgi:hypothetical protein